MKWVDKRRVRTSAGELAVVDVGDGPPVVFLHGFPLSSFQWRAFIPEFSRKFRVIAPDLLGAGESDLAADPEHLRVRPQAGTVRELLDELGMERYAVVGAGLGGAIAQRLAVDDPRVEAMVLLNCPAFSSWPGTEAQRVASRPRQTWSPLLATAAVRTSFDIGMRQRSKLGEQALEEYLLPFVGSRSDAYFLGLAANDGTGLEDMEEALSDVTCPTLILWGEDQNFYPPDTPERLNDAIGSSTLGLLPGCGHFVTEDAPETLVPMIFEYLRAKYAGETHGHGDPSGAVMVQLERRPEWVDTAEFDLDEEETLEEDA